MLPLSLQLESSWLPSLSSWRDASTILYTFIPLLLVLHLVRVRLVRYEHVNSLQRDYAERYALTDAEAAEGKKPRMNQSGYRGVRDAQEIFRMASHFDMPFLTLKALEFALFRTYGIPTISKILLRTGQFVDLDKASKRYVDTSLLIASFFSYPLPPLDLEDNEDRSKPRKREQGFYEDDRKDPRSAIALARINWLHARANKLHEPHGAGISNDDLLYTLSTFIIVPVRWYRLYGWRTATALEAEALFTVFYHAGRCMGIRDIPKTRTELEAWSEAYEAKNMVYADQNEKVAKETVDLLLFHAPRFMRPALSHVVTSLMDERLRLSMGFAKPPSWLYTFSYGLLRMVALVKRHLLLPRKAPKNIVPHNGQGLVDASSSLESQGMIGVCPASGIRAGQENGKMCPVGGAEKQKAMMQTRPKPRLTPNWWENDLHYSRAAPKYSFLWFYERLFVSEDLRRGAKKWRPMHLGKDLPAGPVEGLDCGYRLEECGPRGLEMQGRREIHDEAKSLNGGRDLAGVWGFDPDE